jgi:hypothetical protein
MGRENVVLIKIGKEQKEFGTIQLRALKPEHIDQLTNELRKRQGRKKDALSGARMNTLLLKIVRSVLDLNWSIRDWYTQAATFACSWATISSTVAVTAGA